VTDDHRRAFAGVEISDLDAIDAELLHAKSRK
jgi:hypothetical protein